MFKKFFLLCSAVDMNIIYSCSNSEQNKYAGIGATVFFTAVMAAIASSYALYTVFDHLFAAIVFGLLWGLLIFNLDRFIVSTIRKNKSKWKELGQATPRIILAIIIAMVISKPLELKIFEKEINAVLLEQKNKMTLKNKKQIAQQFEPEIKQLNRDIKELKDEMNTKEEEVNQLYQTYIAEAEGRKGTLLIGKGPVYKEKRDKHDASLLALSELKKDNGQKIASKEAAITQLNVDWKKAEQDTQLVISNFDGFMARINALGKLPWMPSFFILLLFLAIETAPIFVKLVSPKGAYDYQLENAENAIISWLRQQEHQRKELLGADGKINSKVYSDIEEDSDTYRYKQKKTRELLQAQTDAFYEKQKSLL